MVLGATGMAGHMVYYYLKQKGNYKLYNLVFRSKLTKDSIVCDVREKNSLKKILKKIKPHVVINCIGVLVKESKNNPENAIYLNAYLPHLLKMICDDIGGKLIHISTDCVFSGKKGNYSEEEFRDADDIYGRSKALGEIINERDCTLRTSIIGPELKENGEGLFHWFMLNKGEVLGYTKAIWSGITTLELAKVIEKAIYHDLTGLYHVTNGVKISKYELLNLIKKVWYKNDIKIKPFENYFVDKSLIKSQRFSFYVPDYETMLIEMKEKMAQINRYPFYS